ncbi:MAG: hypothetical protein LBB75_00125 [Oscillospiraceae bacterium]|jgi:hypothetical protein|nr:hypothetical protein [Oscillospiraceae bacterium]
MSNLLEAVRQSMREYPALYAVVAGAAALCLFLWVMAVRSSRRRRGERDALIAALEYEKELRAQFKAVTRQQLIDTPPGRLVEGLCCGIQARLEKEPDMQAAYDALPQARRLVYALGYVLQDGREALSGFFRKNGQPLTRAALEAAWCLVGGEYAEIFQREYDAFDEDNEQVSLVRQAVAADDARFAALALERGGALYAQAKEFILANSADFLT